MTLPGRAAVRNHHRSAKIHRSVDTFKGILDRIPNRPLDVRALIGYLGANTLSALPQICGTPGRGSGPAVAHTRPDRSSSGGGRAGRFSGRGLHAVRLVVPCEFRGSMGAVFGVYAPCPVNPRRGRARGGGRSSRRDTDAAAQADARAGRTTRNAGRDSAGRAPDFAIPAFGGSERPGVSRARVVIRKGPSHEGGPDDGEQDARQQARVGPRVGPRVGRFEDGRGGSDAAPGDARARRGFPRRLRPRHRRRPRRGGIGRGRAAGGRAAGTRRPARAGVGLVDCPAAGRARSHGRLGRALGGRNWGTSGNGRGVFGRRDRVCDRPAGGAGVAAPLAVPAGVGPERRPCGRREK